MPGAISAADTSLPELQHNIRLLVEFAEAEIQAVRKPRESAVSREFFISFIFS